MSSEAQDGSEHSFTAIMNEDVNRYLSFVEHSALGVIVLDACGLVTEWNPACVNITNVSAAEALGKHLAEVLSNLMLHEPDQPQALQDYTSKLHQILDEGASVYPAAAQFTLYTSDGQKRAVELIHFLVTAGQSRKLGVFLLDVRERKRSENIHQALYAISMAANSDISQDSLFSLIHTTLQGLMPADNFYIALYDSETGLINFPYFVDQHDSPPEAIKPGRTLTDYVFRTCKPLLALTDRFEELKQSGEVDSVGTPSLDWLGVPLMVGEQVIGVMTVQSYADHLRYSEDEKNVMVFVSNQIAMVIDRKRNEEKLRRSEERYRGVVEDQTELICRTLPDGILIFVNEAFCRAVGNSRQNLLGSSFPNVIGANPYDSVLSHLAELSSEKTVVSYEQRVITPNGEIRWQSWTSRAILDDAGCLIEIQSVGQDVSERKQMEEKDHENRMLAEALRDTAAVLNSTLKFDEVLDHILDNVARVVPHDSASVMFIEAGTGRMLRCKGYKRRTSEEALLKMQFVINEFPYMNKMSRTGQPLFVSDVRTDKEWRTTPNTHWIRSYVGAPIVLKGTVVGLINLDSVTPGFFNQIHAERLQAFANQAATAIENARLYSEIQQLATTDELTGLYNRRKLFELGNREVERALRFGRPLSAVLIDIDHFKQVNDTYGHQAGDQVLRGLANRFWENLREVDILARYGGEEFVVLLPETSLELAVQVGERLRRGVAQAAFITDRGEIAVTISLGAAQMPKELPDLSSLIAETDRALYLAKQNGRNTIATKL